MHSVPNYIKRYIATWRSAEGQIASRSARGRAACRSCTSWLASSAHWLRISGIAMISQNEARVSGPIANSRREGSPCGSRSHNRARPQGRYEWIDARQALIEQAAYGRIAGCAGILDDPGTIDDGANLEALDLGSATAAIAHPCSRGVA